MHMDFLKFFLLIISLNLPFELIAYGREKVYQVDVCVYGGTSAGVIAAYSAKKSGKRVLLIEPGRHLGGMSSGGLGYTDIGNKYVVTGLSRDFYRKIGEHYETFEQWKFEPKVAECIFKGYIKAADVTVMFNYRLAKVSKLSSQITAIRIESSEHPDQATDRVVRAKMFIDCSYEGDLMASAGVSYAIGREDNQQYLETFNGSQLLDGHQLPEGIDPYIEPGNPSSGLIWGVSSGTLQANGKGDKKIQAYNFRITLTNVPAKRITIDKPEHYNAERYELLIRTMAKSPWKSLNDGFIWSLMPNGKTDINNRGGFSTDMIGANWGYPEGNYLVRSAIWQDHVDYTKGLLYFIGHDLRVPLHIRKEMQEWGYPKDEYIDNGNWSHQLYIREARRMVGELVMTQGHCQGDLIVNDGIAMAAYTMDSHNCDRQVVEGMVKNEGNVEKGGFGPYPISYRSIVPKPQEITNLLVPVCMSASHIAYGSIRMEPVFMVLAQSAAVAACLAIDGNQAVQSVNVEEIKKRLKENPLMDGSLAEILVDNRDVQQVSVTGKWEVIKKGGYGPDFLSSNCVKGVVNKVQFRPAIARSGRYKVLSYFPKREQITEETVLNIFDGKKLSQKRIGKKEIQVEGQSTGGWVDLGTLTLEQGHQCYVEITNEGTEGVVVADAVIFVPEKK